MRLLNLVSNCGQPLQESERYLESVIVVTLIISFLSHVPTPGSAMRGPKNKVFAFSHQSPKFSMKAKGVRAVSGK